MRRLTREGRWRGSSAADPPAEGGGATAGVGGVEGDGVCGREGKMSSSRGRCCKADMDGYRRLVVVTEVDRRAVSLHMKVHRGKRSESRVVKIQAVAGHCVG